MKALVTGGGGFLGGRIVRMLCDRGDEPIALGRSSYPDLEALGVRTIRADIRDPEALRRACEGVDVVFHVAALAGVWGKRSDFQSINVEGTRIVLNACRGAGVGRFVYTSSPSVVFGSQPLCGVDESHPYPRRYLADYPASKAEAERLVLAANDRRLSTVAIRPHLVWGPGDPHLVPRIVERARSGGLRQVGDGANLVDMTYVDNAAEAHLLAADALTPDARCAGRPYFISQGKPVVLWGWINDLLQRLGVDPVSRRISPAVATTVGAVFEMVYAVFRIQSEPPMTRFVVGQLCKSHYFDISAARREIGYKPRISMEEGMERLLSWMKSPNNCNSGRRGPSGV